MQDFIGENIQTTFQNRSVFLFNEIYANIQLIMTDVYLTADRKRVPVFIGEPRHEPFTVVATLKNEDGEELFVAGLPIRFDLPRETDGLHRSAVTDYQGRAKDTLGHITAADNGKSIRAYVDVDALCPAKDTRGFFRALIDKLTIPETSLAIATFEDKETFLWHREFEGKSVLILSAYQSKETRAKWTKIRDELLVFVKGHGVNIKHIPEEADFQNTIRLSEDPTAEWHVDALKNVDLVFVMVAAGKFNKRDNAKNPFGEDVQFAGDIRTSVHKSGKIYFSDQYKGATGWNPMGADMCMDVLALHVFKRWKLRYMKQLQE